MTDFDFIDLSNIQITFYSVQLPDLSADYFCRKWLECEKTKNKKTSRESLLFVNNEINSSRERIAKSILLLASEGAKMEISNVRNYEVRLCPQ